MKNLYLKLLEAQKQIKTLKKDTENPYYHSMYLDINSLLGEIKPILSKIGIVILQPLTHLEGRPAIQTIIIDSESGEMLQSITPLIEANDAQKQGAVVTYFRRYALVAMLCLSAEDDDANSAVHPTHAGHDKPVKVHTDEPVYIKDPSNHVCDTCGKPMTNSKFKTCFTCNQKKKEKQEINLDGVPF